MAHQERYELLDVVGSGGMATVWRAYDTRLGRTVALKRPHPAPHDSIVHARFQREAHAAATVSHPNLVTVFDIGLDEEGPFLVMEYVDAPSLADTSIDDVDAVTVGAEIAAALAALHAAGIIHRDVKPANILLPPAGAQLTDFGIARSIDDTAGLTQAGTTFATPAYAAPEVLAHGAYSESSDVYSLAAVLFEIVYGQRVISKSGTQLLVTDPIWKPILDGCLTHDPAARPTAVDFERRLRAASSGQAVVATAPIAVTGPDPTSSNPLPNPRGTPVDEASPGGGVSTGARPRPFRNRPVVAFTAVVVLLIAGLIFLTVSRSGDDGLGSAGTTAVSNTATSAPQAVSETAPAATARATTTATTPGTSAKPVATVLDGVAAARGDFVAFIGELSDDEIKANESEKMIADVDDALAFIADSNVDQAQRSLQKAFDRLDKIKSDDAKEGATIRLERLVTAIGLASG